MTKGRALALRRLRSRHSVSSVAPRRARTPEAEARARRRVAGLPVFDGFCFTVSGRRLTGLTRPLAARFYPDYRLPDGASRGAGREGGRLIHEDLARVITDPVRRAPKYEVTRQLLASFASWGWRVLRAEEAVSFGQLGTAADVVVADAEGRARVVELKTGMAHAFTGHASRSRERLAPPLEDVLSCPLHHAFLQCAATAIMLGRTHRHLRGPILYSVVRVDTERISRYEPSSPELAARISAAVEAWLLQYNSSQTAAAPAASSATTRRFSTHRPAPAPR